MKTSNNAPWFEITSPFETEFGKLMLLEPPTAKLGELRARLLDQTYDKPFVVDDGQLRYLYFSVRLMQSAMRLAAPDELALRYTQKMMAFLLFVPRPERIVLIGLGGGSLLKFCHRHLPTAHFTAVEISPEVIAFGEAFLLPLPGPKLQIIEADGADYVAEAAPGIDVLLIDAFDEHGFAPAMNNRVFLQSAWDKLSVKGVLVVNLAGERESYAGLVGEIMHVFDDQVLIIPVPDDGNHVLLAFRERHFEPRWRWLHNHARELRARFGLDFPSFVQKMERSAKLRLARQMAGGRGV
ncbi:MAG: spermidine synthase-like protein [Betaproteobacteria bacterium]|nr:spermidine synthase-like protein [Betaproteobacteria bacterium]